MQQHLSPTNWKRRAQACVARAGYRCANCGIPHGVRRVGKKSKSFYVVYLHAAHVNHDPHNPQAELRAVYPACHLTYDRRMERTQARLPGGQYHALPDGNTGCGPAHQPGGDRFSWQVGDLSGQENDLLDATGGAHMSVHAMPFEECSCTHYERIDWHVYRLVRQHEQAEGLTQTAFLKAWRAWPPGSDTNMSCWLSPLATRVALDTLIHKRRLFFQSLDVLVEWLEETASSVREDEMCLERLQFMEALSPLPAHTCSLLLRSAQGYSTTELARARGLPKATLARHLAPARAELMLRIEEGHR
jgi:DNA-directed RNA polymerase specialized sigma24 family protein